MADRELAYRICGGTAALVVVVAAAAWTLAGPGQAAGALVGGAVTIANFLWLRWTAGLALRGPVAAGALRRALWVAATGLRFGVVAVTLGVAAAQGGVGLVGLLAVLPALPVTLIAEGLRDARAG